MVAARRVGFGVVLEKRRKEHSDFQQGAEGTKPRGRGFAPHRRRWKQILWVRRSPPLPRVIARHADRAGSDNEGSICHGAVGDEEHGGGSKRYLFWVLRRRDQDFQQEVGHVRRARSEQTKEVVLTAVGQPRRWP
jgi:hypothetical protein